MGRKLVVFLFVFVLLLIFNTRNVLAEGTIVNIGGSVGSDSGSDAVSWANSFPIMIDNYGHYIVPTENTDGNYYLSYSNDKGSTWSDASFGSLTLRPSAVYDNANDKIHILIENETEVKYQRYIIKRNSAYEIIGFLIDPTLSATNFETTGSCTTSIAGQYPILLWKDDGANGILVAFWEVLKTCGGTTVYEDRASMRVLSNTSADGIASNWAPLNGSDDSGSAVGPSLVPFNTLYSSPTSAGRTFVHSAVIQGGSGSKANDIYYFNIDENLKWGFQRFSWNSLSNNWSGSWTSRSIFTANVNGSGYSRNDEIISKPVYDSENDRVYIGVPQWRGSTLRDSQTLYYVDSSDTVIEAGDVYNHLNGTWFAPTMDIMYNSDDNKVYVFYQTSSTDPTDSSQTDTAFEGDAWYRTYDGISFGTPTGFMTQAISGTQYTVDIPIVYKAPDNGRIILFYRADGPETPYVPPHYIFFGYISSGGSSSVNSISANTPYSASSFADFVRDCATLTNSEVQNGSGGEVGLASTIRDDFEPHYLYPFLFSDKWTTGTWTGGPGFFPVLDGTIVVYGSNGAYIYGNTSMTNKILEFRAKFTAHSWEHIGFSDHSDFNKYIMFSTYNDASLHTRQFNNSSEVGVNLGSSYFGSYHTYKIDWGVSSVRYYIDDDLVDTQTTEIPTTALNPVLSNNTNTSGADLTVDWLKVNYFPTTSGSYLSCPISSGITDAVWGALTYTATTPLNTDLTIKTRTSNDGLTWSDYSDAITSGDTVSSAAGKYLQYLISLSGTTAATSTLDDISIAFNSPTPTSTPQTSSNNLNTASPPECNDATPEHAPFLYAASAEGTDAITLYFNDQSKNVTTYALEYGSQSTKYTFGADNIANKGDGSYTVKSLKPNTTYYFRIRANNGCKTGGWSQEISGRTNSGNSNLRVTEIRTESTNVAEQEQETIPATDPTAPGSYKVKIKVVDENQIPIENATVTVHSTPKTAKTNNDGIAEFSDVEQGEHTIQVAYADYQGEQQISLNGEVKEFAISVELKKTDPLATKLCWVIIGFAVALLCVRLKKLVTAKKVKKGFKL